MATRYSTIRPPRVADLGADERLEIMHALLDSMVRAPRLEPAPGRPTVVMRCWLDVAAANSDAIDGREDEVDAAVLDSIVSLL